MPDNLRKVKILEFAGIYRRIILKMVSKKLGGRM
jgi:hypothetical protein